MKENIILNKTFKLPVPWRVTFDTNPDDCNLHCIMCEEFSEFSTIKEARRKMNPNLPIRRRMEFKLIKKVIEEIKDADKRNVFKEIIPSTMGEPLLYQHFEKITDLCHEHNLKLNLTTNGTFPRKSVEEWAHLIIPVCSDVKISWNGVTKDTNEMIMKGKNFEKAVADLKTFIEIRDQIFQEGGNFCRITLQVTFMEMNYQKLPELIRFAAEVGVDRIKGHHLWIHFPEMANQSLRRNLDSIKRWNATIKKMKEFQEKYRLKNDKKVILDNIHELPLTDDPNKVVPTSWQCPFLGREAWVAWNGTFNPCCAPDYLRKKLGYFGNLYYDSFIEIWKGPKYNNLIKNYLKHDVCKTCNMRRPVEEIQSLIDIQLKGGQRLD